MNDYLFLMIHVLASLAISITALHVLAEALGDVLRKICPDDASALFWRNYSKVMLTAAPLVLVLLVGLMARFNNPVDNLRAMLIAALFGLLVGLHLLDQRLSAHFEGHSKVEEQI